MLRLEVAWFSSSERPAYHVMFGDVYLGNIEITDGEAEVTLSMKDVEVVGR